MNIEFNYTRLSPELVQQIGEALQKGEIFGLQGKRTKSVFSIQNLASVFVGCGKEMAQRYGSIEQFQQGISLALLSQKTFIPASQLHSWIISHSTILLTD